VGSSSKPLESELATEGRMQAYSERGGGETHQRGTGNSRYGRKGEKKSKRTSPARGVEKGIPEFFLKALGKKKTGRRKEGEGTSASGKRRRVGEKGPRPPVKKRSLPLKSPAC